MSWHELLRLEIENEFMRLGQPQYDVVVNALWINRQYNDTRWATYGSWWRTTSIGKRYNREYSKSRTKLLKTIDVEIRTCATCGNEFTVTAAQIAHRRGVVCSPECRGAARKNIAVHEIDGQKLTLTQWAQRRGLQLRTVWARLRRGWDIRKALGMESLEHETRGAK